MSGGPQKEDVADYDLVLVGGGLANGLLAYRLAQRRPELSILVLESGPTLGGNHTWSFHEGDLTREATAWLAPFIGHAWSAYDVIFPGQRRRIGHGYATVSSERFHAVLKRRLGPSVRLGCEVVSVEPHRVVLAAQDVITARAVVDGRGLRDSPNLILGYQKFVGQELRFAQPHGLDTPIIMDATVEQLDGYRFVYVLPFGPDRALVEDTYYADAADLDGAALRQRIAAYAESRGWRIAEVLREEIGVLPITLAGNVEAFWREGDPDVARSGLRAALFHPTTGYSLPDAVRLADHIASLPDLDDLPRAISTYATARWRAQGFFRLLNRMLFLAGAPTNRFRVLRRFYGLSEKMISRFYAGRLTRGDKLRLLTGKPPVPFFQAMRVVSEARFLKDRR
jgi:lycopene beta-cyclase